MAGFCRAAGVLRRYVTFVLVTFRDVHDISFGMESIHARPGYEIDLAFIHSIHTIRATIYVEQCMARYGVRGSRV